MHEAYSFYCEIHLSLKIKRKLVFDVSVIHLNDTTLKTLLLQILITKKKFRQLGGLRIFSSTCGQNMSLYGQICSVQIMILRANMLVQAQTIPQNPKCSLFF